MFKNSGHRLGGSGKPNENTLQSLYEAINNSIPEENRFSYWEFDIHESKDNVIFVFHDDFIIFDDEEIELSQLSFSRIKSIGNLTNVEIPTLSEIVNVLENREEDVMIEIKNLHSEAARKEAIEAIRGRENWCLMATPERFIKSFPEETRSQWHNEIRGFGGSLVRVGRHRVDLFAASDSPIRWWFAKHRWFFGF